MEVPWFENFKKQNYHINVRAQKLGTIWSNRSNKYDRYVKCHFWTEGRPLDLEVIVQSVCPRQYKCTDYGSFSGHVKPSLLEGTNHCETCITVCINPLTSHRVHWRGPSLRTLEHTPKKIWSGVHAKGKRLKWDTRKWHYFTLVLISLKTQNTQDPLVVGTPNRIPGDCVSRRSLTEIDCWITTFWLMKEGF